MLKKYLHEILENNSPISCLGNTFRHSKFLMSKMCRIYPSLPLVYYNLCDSLLLDNSYQPIASTMRLNYHRYFPLAHNWLRNTHWRRIYPTFFQMNHKTSFLSLFSSIVLYPKCCWKWCSIVAKCCL